MTFNEERCFLRLKTKKQDKMRLIDDILTSSYKSLTLAMNPNMAAILVSQMRARPEYEDMVWSVCITEDHIFAWCLAIKSADRYLVARCRDVLPPPPWMWLLSAGRTALTLTSWCTILDLYIFNLEVHLWMNSNYKNTGCPPVHLPIHQFTISKISENYQPKFSQTSQTYTYGGSNKLIRLCQVWPWYLGHSDLINFAGIIS